MRVAARWAPAVAVFGVFLAGCAADPTTAPPAPLEPGQSRVTIEVIGMT